MCANVFQCTSRMTFIFSSVDTSMLGEHVRHLEGGCTTRSNFSRGMENQFFLKKQTFRRVWLEYLETSKPKRYDFLSQNIWFSMLPENLLQIVGYLWKSKCEMYIFWNFLFSKCGLAKKGINCFVWKRISSCLKTIENYL